MSKKRKIVWTVVAVIFLWFGAWWFDYGRVLEEERPIFCIEIEEGHYIGLGYSFVTYEHPITGKLEFVAYVFGILENSNYTN